MEEKKKEREEKKRKKDEEEMRKEETRKIKKSWKPGQEPEWKAWKERNGICDEDLSASPLILNKMVSNVKTFLVDQMKSTSTKRKPKKELSAAEIESLAKSLASKCVDLEEDGKEEVPLTRNKQKISDDQVAASQVPFPAPPPPAPLNTRIEEARKHLRRLQEEKLEEAAKRIKTNLPPEHSKRRNSFS